MPERIPLGIKRIAQIVLQVALVVLFHLALILYLNLKTVKWDDVGIYDVLVTYCCPFVLVSATCMMAIKTKKIRYNLVWIITSFLPSAAILFNLKTQAVAEPSESAIIIWNPPPGLLELMLFFPLVYSFIQVILMIAMWIMKVTREARHE
ncbi:hypothetical protein [Paenibacillus sp. MMS20-IR301]|uniref:hypothetical protein n=1 Tax=Paenibacillus sp. MMS20-IR301 TaxID=2895946 RepID=UPI0028E65CF1|nr:hypothetical protein [Paenibacillus sp. MMS20-IR301]WNS46401.1 hypothetical protein LOS79_14445 [Paenibacillus sp. MMS20-IR301]